MTTQIDMCWWPHLQHSSYTGTSLCATKHIHHYFRHGELPDKGTICEIKEILFSSKLEAAKVLNMEDQELLDITRELAANFHVAVESYFP
jgi:hypothetical protein